MVHLQGHHQPLARPHQTQGQPRHQRQGDDQHGPDRRLIGDLNEQGPEHHDPACDLHDEDGRAIAGIQTGKVEPADRAPVDDLQEPREQRPLGAMGTAAKQSGPDRIDPGRRWRHRLWVWVQPKTT